MNTPIINPSTLTEEQKMAIRTLYMYAKTNIVEQNEIGQVAGYSSKILLEALFGKDFFEKGE